MVTRISLSPLGFRSVGFDSLIREVESMLNDDAKPSTFPPHNIIKDEASTSKPEVETITSYKISLLSKKYSDSN